MYLEEKGDGVYLRVKVVPNSSRDEVVGVLGDALKVKVAAVPEGGKANRAVEELLAKVLGVSKKSVEVVAGMTQARKVVRVVGVAVGEIRRLLGTA